MKVNFKVGTARDTGFSASPDRLGILRILSRLKTETTKTNMWKQDKTLIIQPKEQFEGLMFVADTDFTRSRLGVEFLKCVGRKK